MIPSQLLSSVAHAHPSWQPIIQRGLDAMDARYLAGLSNSEYLPTNGRIFAAFQIPLNEVKYVLVGEGPYPRAESATGVCFMDGAVGDLWCSTGLSKPVNKATSLRNFMKMLLVCSGDLQHGDTNGEALARAVQNVSCKITTMRELQDNLIGNGFLLLNASLVYRPDVAPAIDARAWFPFLQVVLDALAPVQPKLVLWGRIAEQLKKLPQTERFEQICSEHPFNVSFIGHTGMQALFGPMKLLERRG